MDAPRPRGLPPALRALSAPLALLALLGASTVAADPPFKYPGPPPWCADEPEKLLRSLVRCIDGARTPRAKIGTPTRALDDALVVAVCRRARTPAAADALVGCVGSVLFERKGLGRRQEDISEEASVIACAGANDTSKGTAIFECMRGLMYERGGLSHRRTGVSDLAAAHACSAAGAQPLHPWSHTGQCPDRRRMDAARALERCVRQLAFEPTLEGEPLSPDLAAVACRGLLEPAL